MYSYHTYSTVSNNTNKLYKNERIIGRFKPVNFTYEKQEGQRSGVTGETNIECNSATVPQVTNLIPYVKLERINVDQINVEVPAEPLSRTCCSAISAESQKVQNGIGGKRDARVLGPEMWGRKIQDGRRQRHVRPPGESTTSKNEPRVVGSKVVKGRKTSGEKKSREKQRFSCPECYYTTSIAGSMRTHKLIHSDVKPFYCKSCEYCCRQAVHLRRHIFLKHTIQEYQCKECGCVYDSQYRMEKHRRELHRPIDKHAYCDICQKYLSSRLRLNLHNVRFHMDKAIPHETFTCGDCSAEFGFKILLRNHIKRNHLPPTYKPHLRSMNRVTCDHCERSFACKKHLIYHLRIHFPSFYQPKTSPHPPQPPQWFCDKCAKTFHLKSALTTHIKRAHGPKKTVSCDKCQKHFSRKDHMIRHRKTHDNITFSCADCSKAFKNKISLDKHIEKNHLDRPYQSTAKPSESFECHVCSKSLGAKVNLSAHLFSVHGFGSARFKCFACEKEFFTKHRLELHERIHRVEKPLACKDCGKRFKTNSNLYQHSRVHSDERRFTCGVCQTGFRFKHHLRQHMRSSESKGACSKMTLR